MDEAKKKELFSALINRVSEITRKADDPGHGLSEICTLLRENVPHYDWVGFYLTDPNAERELVLGPFAGEPTEHVRISFGQGICGQAAERKQTFMVPDVSKEKNYLSCSPAVKSEIVLPVLRQGRVLGELDIDSHTLDAFSDEDRGFLLKVCYAATRLLKDAQESRKEEGYG